MVSSGDPAGGPVAILLVEDEPADAELCLRALARHRLASGTTWVQDGVAALDFLFARGGHAGRSRDDLPRLILLDLKLPKVDGFEVLRQVRADPVLRVVPVVLLTSSAEERDIAECYRLGANSFVTKPVDFTHFQEVIGDIGRYWLLVNRAPAGFGPAGFGPAGVAARADGLS